MSLDVVDIDHVAIRVSDLEESLHFYHDLLGLAIRDRDRYDEGIVPFVSLVAGGRHIHLFPQDAPFEVSEETYGHEHICLILRSDDREPVEQMREILDGFREAGVQVDSVEGGSLHGHRVDQEKKAQVFAEGREILNRFGTYGYGIASYIRDPDGRVVELKLQ